MVFTQKPDRGGRAQSLREHPKTGEDCLRVVARVQFFLLPSRRHMTTTSYGVLILNEHGQLFLAHATGQKHWDIPKGGAEQGESAREAALREVREETGLDLSNAPLADLGVVRYLPQKNLHLFKTVLLTRDWDIAACNCTSFFPHHATGVPTPEVDRYRWVDMVDVPKFATKSMTSALKTLPGFEAVGPSPT